VGFHEHNLLPFSTSKSYVLLSAESKATEAANNKERLVICHCIVWCRTILQKIKQTRIRTNTNPNDAEANSAGRDARARGYWAAIHEDCYPKW
jgi:hypothetical protein